MANYSKFYDNYDTGGVSYNRSDIRTRKFIRGYRKSTGSKIGVSPVTGKPYVSAWKKNRKGFFTLFAYPFKVSKEKSSGSNHLWLAMSVKIVNQTTSEFQLMSGLFDLTTRRLHLPVLGQIVTSGGKGGYWGPVKTSKRR